MHLQHSKQAAALWVLGHVWLWGEDAGFGREAPLDALQPEEGFCFHQNAGRSQVCQEILCFSSVSYFLEEMERINLIKTERAVVYLNCRQI